MLPVCPSAPSHLALLIQCAVCLLFLSFEPFSPKTREGASFLAGIDLRKNDGIAKSMIVVDVGGTTTDVDVLLPSGFPRQAAAFIEGLLHICFQNGSTEAADSCRRQNKVRGPETFGADFYQGTQFLDA